MEKIRASVDPRLLSKVDRIFDASPRTVFNELLQNARRAGATEVTVSMELDNSKTGVIVEFSDNGEGLETPKPLLRLAGSGWGDGVEVQEDPAGMGFFCMSNFAEVWVRSRGWRATFTADVFRGQVLLDPQPSETRLTGVWMMWNWEGQTLHTLQEALQGAAEYCDLESVLLRLDTGEKQTEVVIKPKDYLEGVDCFRSVPVLGVEMGVLRDTLTNTYGVGVCVNFHGVQVSLSQRGDHLKALEQLHLSVRVNVINVGDLQLVLPARNALKHNAGRDALLLECERLCYDWVVKQGKHSLPFEVYQRAKEVFNIDIGETSDELRPASGEYSRNRTLPAVVIPSGIHYEWLSNVLDKFDVPLDFCRANAAMAGYSWYDALPVVQEFYFEIDAQHIDWEIVAGDQSTREDPPSGLLNWEDSIVAVLELSDGQRFTQPLQYLIFGECEASWFSDMGGGSYRILLSRALEGDQASLTSAGFDLRSMLFDDEQSFDCEESYEERYESFTVAFMSALFEFTGDTWAAAHFQVASAMGGLDYVTGPEWVWSLHKDHGSIGNDLLLVGPHLKEEVRECRKLVTMIPHGSTTGPSCEIFSRTPLTRERVATYLCAIRGYNEETDLLVIEDYTPPINLDKWEATQ